MLRQLWPAAALAISLAPGCLREAEGFIEPASAYGDCSEHPEVCGEGLACQSVGEQAGIELGYSCAPTPCDMDERCPRAPTGQARPRCLGGLCTLECNPTPCGKDEACTECPADRSCADACGRRLQSRARATAERPPLHRVRHCPRRRLVTP